MLGSMLLLGCASAEPGKPARELTKRWLFVWREMTDPAEVDRTIALFPRAEKAGYNAVVLTNEIAPGKVEELKAAAQQHHLALIPIVMGGPQDRNYMEGVPVKEALFVAHGGTATFQRDPPITAGGLRTPPLVVPGGDFENVRGDHFLDWTFQDNEGRSIFADHQVVHGGKTSVRMENIGASHPAGNCRFSQKLTLRPFRQYHITVWTKTEDLRPAEAEVKVLTPDSGRSVSFQTFGIRRTEDWTRHDLAFNTLRNSDVMLYMGVWGGGTGKLWWDDLSIEEIGLVNVLRRPGCPVSVHGENGVVYEEGRDFEAIRDPNLHPWQAYHEMPPIRLTANTRIKEGERLRVSYYHPLIVYEDRLNGCLSEPKIFEWWREEVKQADEMFHPPAFFMSHDEIRIINWCALCQSRHLTPGELLADNVHRAAQVIRDLRPDAEIWVWNDMFDPMHNAVDDYYACNGTLRGSWKGLDPGIGIVNWHGGLKGKNCQFFADLGEKQVLAGYYDGDEDGAGIAEWLKNTEGVPGIVGAMYTTWGSNYDAMEAWAKRAWGGGPR
jgi:hypothetical protein